MNKLLILIGLLFATPSLADTDYVCLKNCASTKTSTPKCMQQCTYNTPKKAQGTAKGPKKNNFDQFSTLKEADRIVVQRDARQDGRLNKNYSCVASCLKGGMQYQLCQTQCTQ